jgi:hypothetical protein
MEDALEGGKKNHSIWPSSPGIKRFAQHRMRGVGAVFLASAGQRFQAN